MGTLIAKAYPAEFLNQADHTYVMCGTGGKAWGCWGGKTGGHEIRRGTGSTNRADKIARPDEKANIKCYLINGVCHQSANRILLPANITVLGARGYSISEALFGTYGRVCFWPCQSPFNQYPGVTGDLPECAAGLAKVRTVVASRPAVRRGRVQGRSYIQGVLAMYRKAAPMALAAVFAPAEAENFHVGLFMHMAKFHLGSRLNSTLSKRLKAVRSATEKARIPAETAFANHTMSPREFVDAVNRVTLQFQDEMANALTAAQYKTLFDMDRDERVILADRAIVKRVFRV
jgi:hypothetical protein